MIHTERISAWLKEPHQLQEIAPEAIQHLAKEYPFFTPAHYLLFINGHQEDAVIARLQQSNPVNPVMLGSFIQAAREPQIEVETLVATLTETETKIETVQEASVIQTLTEATQQEAKEPEDILSFIQPASSEDYFLQQGIKISNDIPDFTEIVASDIETDEEKEKALMVVMSFAEWLKHISSKSTKAKEEVADKKALKTMWQQQKLAAAIEEENEEIPEQVFEMAVNSIARKDELVSESFANVYAKQGKFEKAIEMYQKLSLLYPEKNAYFAAKIETLQKEI